MAATKARRTSANHAPSLARWTITLCVFLAFAFQSYVTQTHIHFAGEAAVDVFAPVEKSAPAAKIAPQGKQKPDKTPPKDDPANCPICQEILYAGHYVMPAFVAPLLPSQPISIVPIVIALPTVVKTVSHAWQGRAPPRI
jgi:hypothetical protein